nr:vinculin-like [Lytechinus pictus]
MGLSQHDPGKYEEATTFLRNVIEVFKGVKIGVRGDWKRIQTGVILSTTSVLSIAEELLSAGHAFLLTSRLTQHCLENLFSSVRLRKPVPTPLEFKKKNVELKAELAKRKKGGELGSKSMAMRKLAKNVNSLKLRDSIEFRVSQLVILHEEAQDGNAMPDLSNPVMAVSAAVQNLVKVGKDTANSTDDKILKQEMPPAFTGVEESANKLAEAAMQLKQDPYSSPARKKLIDGARGILGGTSDLLLCFDQSEVRKIVRVAKGVLEYLAVSEVVECLEDLVTFVKNLSPGMANMANKVTSRSKELTHTAHANGLINHTENLKRTTPILVSSMKIFVATLKKGGAGRDEAQQNRNFIIGCMSHDVNEIIRILQLTSADDDELSLDDLAIMKKSLLNITNQMTMAQTWLANPDGEPGGLGEKAVRDILRDARRVADRLEGPQRERLLTAINEIEAMMNELCDLRAKGQGNSPRALQLSRQIAEKLDHLHRMVDGSVKEAVRSGVTRTAYTLAGKVEQAQKWLRNPAQDDKGLGRKAIAGIVAQGRKVAQNLTGPERSELLRLCDEVEGLSQQITDLVNRGQGNSPACLEAARRLAEKLPVLQKAIENALVREVADVFMDTTTPLKELERAAKAPINVPDRQQTYTSKATIFLKHANKVSDTAKLVAEAGASNDRLLTFECSSFGFPQL